MNNFEKEFKEGLLKLIDDFKEQNNKDMESSLKSSNKHIINEIDYVSKVQDKKVSMFIKYENKLNFIDAGRRQGKQPPLNIITNWCKAKNIATKFAYPIAKHIGDNGIQPQPFLFHIDKNLNDFYKNVQTLLNETFKDNIDNNNNKKNR